MNQTTQHLQPERRGRRPWRRLSLLLMVTFACLVPFSSVRADAFWDIHIPESELKRIADGTLTLIAFTVLPDITTSSITIDSGNRDNPDMFQTTLGGGFTLSPSFPLYLEGTLGYSRYDPTFIASNGEDNRKIPLKWNSLAVTGGVGWDFPVTPDNELKLRPIFNFTLGYVATDVSLAQAWLNEKYDLDLDLFDNGSMNAYGLGGALMLDYEHYRETYEIDVELRYTYIRLQSFGGSIESLKGNSETNSASLWARWRAPTGIKLLKRPLRYVLETSVTSFFGPQRGALGFDNLGSLGAGIELDSSAYKVIITRTRLVGRYIFGDNVSGVSIGLAVSF